ncbi:MAG: BLUF domain-containing protein [Kordiimonadaceae bacterium]|nr:BLUF domain-containing protein [Kordiimonadaceae bacterium]
MYHLVYISDRNQGHARDMEQFVNNASNFNEEHNITGALWFSDTEFVHLMEGDTSDLETMYNYVTNSASHNNVELVCIKKCGQRFFGDWSMASFGDNTHSGMIAQQFGTSRCFQPRKLPPDRLINLLYFLEEERIRSAKNAIC